METREERFKKYYDYGMKYWCEDDPDFKALALKYNAEASDEAVKLHKESIIIDTCTFYLESCNWQLEQSGATALSFTVPVCSNPEIGSAMRRMASYLAVANKYPDKFINILKADDILEAKRSGKVGVILGAQSCNFFEDTEMPAVVELFARAGMRVAQIAYNARSFAADGCLCGTDAGITWSGRQLIAAMEKSGITVDLSHVGRRSTLEAMECATKPMIFSHSNPKALFDHPRNIRDDQAKACAALGGVVGVCAYSPILFDGVRHASVDRWVDAVAYYADLIGIDHVGMGLDSNAEPGAYERCNARAMMEELPDDPAAGGVVEAGYKAGLGKGSLCTEGIVNMSNHLNIVDKLLKRGFSHDDVKKVMGENFLRVFRATWR